MKRQGINNHGFTLVELMVGLALAAIVGVVITMAYTVQTRVHDEQDALVEMQQNSRAALLFLQSELRRAGYNPTGMEGAGCGSGGAEALPGIHTATVSSIGFSMDLDGNGDCRGSGENVLYQLYNPANGVMRLGRTDLTGNAPQQPIAENISVGDGTVPGLEFTYLFRFPRSGEHVRNAPTTTPAAAELADIRAVQISLITRSELADKQGRAATVLDVARSDAWGNTENGAVQVTFNDTFRYRYQRILVDLRNMGLGL